MAAKMFVNGPRKIGNDTVFTVSARGYASVAHTTREEAIRDFHAANKDKTKLEEPGDGRTGQAA